MKNLRFELKLAVKRALSCSSLLIVVGFFLVCNLHAQTPAYYHDTALDNINGGVGNIDADINYWGSRQLNTNDLNLNAYNHYKVLTNSPQRDFNIGASTTNVNYQAAAFYQSMGSNLSKSVSVLTTNFGTPISGRTYSIPLSHGYSMNLSADSVPHRSLFALASTIISVIVYLIYFLYALEYIQKELLGIVNQRQTQGSNMTILGTNASTPTALFYAAILTAALSTVVGLLLASSFMSGGVGVVSSFNTTMNFQTSTFWNFCDTVFDILTLCFPIVTILSTWANYLIFRYVYAYPLFMFVRGLIRWLPI